MEVNRVSVITINYNNLDGLIKTHQSILRQNYYHFDHIVIDGYSTDGSIEYLESNCKNYLISRDSGIYDAMNKGIDRASGNWIVFLNSGDIFYPHAIREMMDVINQNDFDFVISAIDIFSSSGKFIFKKIPNNLNYSDYLNSMPAAHMSFFVKKSIYTKLGNYNNKFKVSGDFDLIQRLFRLTKNYAALEISIGAFYLGGKSSSFKVIREDFKILSQYGMPLSKNVCIFFKKTLKFIIRQFIPSQLYVYLAKILNKNA